MPPAARALAAPGAPALPDRMLPAGAGGGSGRPGPALRVRRFGGPSGSTGTLVEPMAWRGAGVVALTMEAGKMQYA